MPANSDQQSGQYGKIHFIKSILFILALMAVLLPPKVQLQGPGKRLGTPAPPERSRDIALKGLTCSQAACSEPLGSWLPVSHADVWAQPVSGPTPTSQFCTTLYGEAVSLSAWLSPSGQLALSCTICSRLWTVDRSGQHPASLGQDPVS